MSELKTTTSNSWSGTQAVALAVFSLLLGISGGWLIRRSFASEVPASVEVAPAAAPSGVSGPTAAANFNPLPAAPSTAELKQAADAQAAPLLERLKADPKNAALLAQVGNLYYDAKQYPAAIIYYEQSLKSQPSDTSVGTDLGTAYWYTGDADGAIARFTKVLAIAPTKPDTLFNLGIVKWQGKKDAQGAIAAWQKLLDANPNYENREKVLQLIAQAQNH
ncbi:MAG: tetratricopeptide repeat protein [Candidatus Acidiferrum sp.]